MTDHIQSYHRRTMYDPLKMVGYALDGSYQPGVYKNYPGLIRVNLPEIAVMPDTSFSERLRPCHAAPTAAGKSRKTVSFPSIPFYITAIFYRSIWKYRDRAYRYAMISAGWRTGFIWGRPPWGWDAAASVRFMTGRPRRCWG